MPEVLPELGALSALVALLIIAAGLWVLQGLIRNSLGRLPVVGGWINSNIDAALNDARNAVLRGAGATWGVAKTLFRWMIAFFKNPMAQILFLAAEAYSFGRKVVDVYLPELQTRVLVDASGWFSSAESYALGLYRTAQNYTTGLVAQALVTASGWFTAAENRAIALFNTATTDIANGIVRAETDAANLVTNASSALKADILAAENLAIGDINALDRTVQSAINTLSADITAGIATAESLAAVNLSAVAGGIYTDLDTWGKRAVADAWPDAQRDIGALRNTLGADFPWLNDLLGALGGLGAAGLLGSLIQSMAGAQAITRLATDCVVPQCRNLGGLSHDLGDLLGTASTAAMLAWLIFAVTDPSGWSSEMMAVAAPVATQAAGAATRLFEGG